MLASYHTRFKTLHAEGESLQAEVNAVATSVSNGSLTKDYTSRDILTMLQSQRHAMDALRRDINILLRDLRGFETEGNDEGTTRTAVSMQSAMEHLVEELNDLKERCELLEAPHWGDRVNNASDDLKAMKEEALLEIAALEAEEREAHPTSCVLTHYDVSQPGQKEISPPVAYGATEAPDGSGPVGSTATPTASELQQKLLQLEVEDVASQFSATVISAAMAAEGHGENEEPAVLPITGSNSYSTPASPTSPTSPVGLLMEGPTDTKARRSRFNDHRCQLQQSFRRHEKRTTENFTSQQMAELSILPTVAETQAKQRQLERIATVSQNPDRQLAIDVAQRIDALNLPEYERDGGMSKTVQSRFERAIDSRNAQELFNGYIRFTQKAVASLDVAAGMKFITVPPFEYRLGYSGKTSESTLLPMGGSSDPTARLDQRTQSWLLSSASDVVSGTTFKDGPLHHYYHSTPRTVDLLPFYVSETPVTVRQYLKLRASKRFAQSLQNIVDAQVFANPKLHHHYIPAFLKGEMHDIIATEPIADNDGGGDLLDQPLEVPYFAAAAIAEVLEGVVCPMDVWEAAARGVEGYAHPMGCEKAMEHVVAGARRVDWSVEVKDTRYELDGRPQRVKGHSYRITQKSMKALTESCKSPMGLKHLVRCGAEWNSTVRCGKRGADSSGDPMPFPPNVEYPPMSHILRSTADYGTQRRLDGNVYSNEQDNRHCFIGPTLDTFGLPNRGTPVAAFRIAFPVFSEAADALKQRIEVDQATKTGADLTFGDLCRGLGTPWVKISSWNEHLAFGESVKDPLYGHTSYLFPSSGLDLSFGAEVPHVLRGFTCHYSPQLAALPLAVHECQTFKQGCNPLHPFIVDSFSKAGFCFPICGRESVDRVRTMIRQAGCRVVVDAANEFSFEDTITARVNTAAQPVAHAVRVSLGLAKMGRANPEEDTTPREPVVVSVTVSLT